MNGPNKLESGIIKAQDFPKVQLISKFIILT